MLGIHQRTHCSMPFSSYITKSSVGNWWSVLGGPEGEVEGEGDELVVEVDVELEVEFSASESRLGRVRALAPRYWDREMLR